MDGVDAMLRSSPNLRVIHLLRDPRGVARSRSLMGGSLMGLRASSDPLGVDPLVLEAVKYCRTAARDVRLRRELERQHPGRILEVVYDAFVTDVERHVRTIHSFLGMTLEEADAAMSKVKVEVPLDGLPNRQMEVNRWRREMDFATRVKVRNVCREFYEAVARLGRA